MAIGIVKTKNDDYDRGASAGEGGVDPDDLYRCPSLEFLQGYYLAKQYEGRNKRSLLPHLLALAHTECKPKELDKVLSEITALSENTITVLFNATVQRPR